MSFVESNQLPLPTQRKIKPPRSKRKKPRVKKVAAYIGRCADEKKRRAQRLFFTSKISTNPFWKLVNIYEDSDSLGEQRVGFNALMDDCSHKKIDIVLTTDITLLSNRASEISKIISQFSSNKISLHLEREGVETLSRGGKFLQSILANIETDWRDLIDENFTLAAQQLFFEGAYHHYALYGYRWKNNRFEVSPKEAESIVLMFQLFAEGKTLSEISSELASNGYVSRNRKPFRDRYIYSIFNQEKYRGFTFVHKNAYRPVLSSVTEDFVTSPLILKGTHPKLIDDDLYQMFLKEQERRRSKEIINWRRHSCFTRRIRCGVCGEMYVLAALTESTKTPFNQGNYQCRAKCKANQNKHLEQCSNKNLPVYTLKKICTRVLAPLAGEERSTSFKDSWVETLVDKIVVFDGLVVLHLKSGQIITQPWKNTAFNDYWTLVNKLKNDHFNQADQEKDTSNIRDEKLTNLNGRKGVLYG